MKKFIFLPLVFFVTFLNAQDLIILKDDSVIKAKIIEISNSQTKYKNHSNLDGPLRIINTSDISMIIYENGEKEVFRGFNQNNYNNEDINYSNNIEYNENNLLYLSDHNIFVAPSDMEREMYWDEAVEACQKIGMRLPDQNEMECMCERQNNIKARIPGLYESAYWTIDQCRDDEDAWVITMNDCEDEKRNKRKRAQGVRCVKDKEKNF